MNREVQVRICEGLGVKIPGPTRQNWPTGNVCARPVCPKLRTLFGVVGGSLPGHDRPFQTYSTAAPSW
jgi:hypothetical protein